MKELKEEILKRNDNGNKSSAARLLLFDADRRCKRQAGDGRSGAVKLEFSCSGLRMNRRRTLMDERRTIHPRNSSFVKSALTGLLSVLARPSSLAVFVSCCRRCCCASALPLRYPPRNLPAMAGGPYSGTSTLALVARISAVSIGVVYGSVKLAYLKAKAPNPVKH